MALLLSTTGTLDPVILYDLGERTFNHPTVNVNLELEYPLWELLESVDLRTALANAEIVLNFDGDDINVDQFDTLARGNMQTFTYDVDDNGIVDLASTSGFSTYANLANNSTALGGQNGAFYLDRTNHTGTQTSATISDFTSAVQAVVTATAGTAGYAGFASTAGWAINAAHAYTADLATLATTATTAINANNSDLLDNQDGTFYLNRANHTGTNDADLLQGQAGAFYLNRANHTGTQLAATISDFVSVTNGLIGAYGTSGWATNAANAYALNNQPASFYLNTSSSINALVDVDTVTVPPVQHSLFNYSTAGTGNWVPISPKSVEVRNSWTISAGASVTGANNRYCDWWGGTMNLSGYVVPTNATIQYITAATNGAETWIAEVRNGGVNVAQLSITAAASARSTVLAVNVNAGDIITLYINGTGINRPTITVHFIER